MNTPLTDRFQDLDREALIALARKERYFHNMRLAGIDTGSWVYQDNLPQNCQAVWRAAVARHVVFQQIQGNVWGNPRANAGSQVHTVLVAARKPPEENSGN